MNIHESSATILGKKILRPGVGPKQSDWFKARFMGNRFSSWLQIIQNHFIIEDVCTTLLRVINVFNVF